MLMLLMTGSDNHFFSLLEFSRLKFELGLHERRFGGVDFIARKRGNVVLIFFSREIFT